MVHQRKRGSIVKALQSRLIYYIFTGGVMGALLVFIDGWWSVKHHLSQLLIFEIPLMIMALELGYVSQKKRWGLTLVLPLIPLLISYLLFEQFFNFLARTPRPSDFQNAHLIFEVSIPLGVGFIMVIALVPISIGMIGWTLYKSHHPDTPRAHYAVKGLIIIPDARHVSQ